ncbi:hypothetical protein WR25_05932 [Diploscapter pachys]|uniref:Uncharacterized protein n=1 Tax=Diploscapter pachys TaxID=2018661 RepID=A0A2A2K026_9BILA|nr:hypothetical protein WR25_05932 [Diploscapter pachys]
MTRPISSGPMQLDGLLLRLPVGRRRDRDGRRRAIDLGDDVARDVGRRRCVLDRVRRQHQVDLLRRHDRAQRRVILGDDLFQRIGLRLDRGVLRGFDAGLRGSLGVAHLLGDRRVRFGRGGFRLADLAVLVGVEDATQLRVQRVLRRSGLIQLRLVGRADLRVGGFERLRAEDRSVGLRRGDASGLRRGATGEQGDRSRGDRHGARLGNELGIVALLGDERLGEVDTQRTERRRPVDADADADARRRAAAVIGFLERRDRLIECDGIRLAARTCAARDRRIADRTGRRTQRRRGRAVRRVGVVIELATRRVGQQPLDRQHRHVARRIGDRREARGRQRLGQAPQAARLDVDRGTQAQFARAGAQRDLQLGADQVIGTAAQRVVDDLIAIGDEDLLAVRVRRIGLTLHARADATDVEAAELRFTEVEAIGDADAVDAGATALFQRMDIAALTDDRADEAAADVPELRPFDARTDILHVTAQAREVLVEGEALARGRTQAAVEAVVDQRVADGRRPAVADCFAEVTARLQRIANAVGEIGRRIETDLIVGQAIAAGERPIFGQRHARTHLEPGRHLRIGRLALRADIVERVEVAAEHVDADRDVLVEQIRLGEAQLDRLRIGRIVHARAQHLALAAEIVLRDVRLDDEAFEAGIADRQLQFAGC